MEIRRIRGRTLAAAVLALAAGCSKTETAASAGMERRDLNVAVVPALDSAGFFVALYGGLFKAAGLNVNFTPATSSDTVIADQVKGTYDITGGNSKITSLAGLKGKTVAINAPKNILYLLAASMMAEHGMNPKSVKFVNVPFPAMAAELKAGAIDAALLPEPFASEAEQTNGAVPLVDLDQGATTAFPIAGFVVTKQWAAKNPRTLAAFYRALEEGKRIADNNRAAVEHAMEALPVKPVPLAVSKETAAVMALDSYPVSSGPVGSVDVLRLQRVVNGMRQFLGFPSFSIKSMLMNGG